MTAASLPSEWLDPLLDARHKGWPAQAGALRRSQVGAQGWQLFDGMLPLPLAVVRRSVLDHNLRWMQDYCATQGVALAPHGKTTMSPQLFARQLDAGAWGLTVATIAQLQVAVAAGARRAVIANQLVQPVDLAALSGLLAAHPGLRVLFLLDSIAQLALIEAERPPQALEVLLEVGLAGGRTGTRTHDEAMALARAARASAAVRLAGIETYEGSLASYEGHDDAAKARALMDRVHAVARQCAAEGLFETAQAGDAIVLSAGGSAIFDLVAPALRLALDRPMQGVLRSGCYVTHDDGHYRRLVGAVNRRLGCSDAQGLRAALQVWAVVQSVPEPGLALLSAGRRDVSYDIEMPIPRLICPRGERLPRPVPEGWRVSALNDQHAYLRTGSDVLQVGDRIGLGISHPCTTFDKWRWMAVVDDDWRVVDALVTYF